MNLKITEEQVQELLNDPKTHELIDTLLEELHKNPSKRRLLSDIFESVTNHSPATVGCIITILLERLKFAEEQLKNF